jgi:nicotinamide riboside kinase
MLKALKKPYVIVEGSREERLRQALAAIQDQ